MSNRLSRRELQCLRLAAQELSNKDIEAVSAYIQGLR